MAEDFPQRGERDLSPEPLRAPASGTSTSVPHVPVAPVHDAANRGTTTIAVGGAKGEGRHSCASYTELAWYYTRADYIRRPRNCCIGLASIFIIVFFVGLILLGTSKTPIIFLRFVELSAGEMDATILAEGSVPFANFTRLEPRLQQSGVLRGSAPRWILKGGVKRKVGSYETVGALYANRSVRTNILVIDSAAEGGAGVGRGWPYRQIGFGEAQAYHSALRFLDVDANVGERIEVTPDITGILEQQNVTANGLLPSTPTVPSNNWTMPPSSAFRNQTITVTVFGVPVTVPLEVILNATFNNTNATLWDALNSSSIREAIVRNQLAALLAPSLLFTVADSVESAKGKYPSALGNVVILDYKSLVEQLLETVGFHGLHGSPIQCRFGAHDSNERLRACHCLHLQAAV